MADKTCKRCGKINLDWDFEWQKKTGKWKLENHKVITTGKWCNKPYEVTVRKRSELSLCQLCSESSFGLLLKNEESIGEHMRMYHGDGRSLSQLDYKLIGGMSKSYIKYWRNDPSYHRYKHLDTGLK